MQMQMQMGSVYLILLKRLRKMTHHKVGRTVHIHNSIIIYREGLDLTLPILPCLQGRIIPCTPWWWIEWTYSTILLMEHGYNVHFSSDQSHGHLLCWIIINQTTSTQMLKYNSFAASDLLPIDLVLHALFRRVHLHVEIVQHCFFSFFT